MSSRTFKIEHKHMTGKDVKSWQEDVKKIFKREFKIDCPIVADGDYGLATRSYTADLVTAMGLSPKVRMKEGVTPELRVMLRNNKLTAAQKAQQKSKTRTAFREKLKRQYAQARVGKVHTPVMTIVTDSWGWTPPIHDGVDVITKPDPIIFAMVKCKVVDVRADGWWGLGAPTDPKLRGKGDGIIQLEVVENVGPFKKGMHICYGHAEKAMVKVGDVVPAGTPIGRAGFARAWHIHLMVNRGEFGLRGKGSLDPRPLLDYAVKNTTPGPAKAKPKAAAAGRKVGKAPAKAKTSGRKVG